jgi:adenylate kinase
MNHTEIATIAEIVAREVSAKVSAMSTGRWLTLQEAKEYAKVRSDDTIRGWIDKGYIYAFKRSGHYIVDRESIDDWYNSDRI